MEFLSDLPWPHKSQIFTSICLGLISLVVLALPRIIINAWAERVLPADRVKRLLIIKQHNRNDHASKLKYCTTGFCSDLSPKHLNMSHHLAATVASEVALHD